MTDEPDASDPADEPLQGALARARDAIAAPPPPLDDATRRGLIDRALSERAAARSRPPSRLPALLAAAAVVAVVGLGAWALLSSGHTRTLDSGSKAESSGTTALAPRAGLGEVSDPHQLLARVRAALQSQPQSRSGNGSTTAAAAADAACATSVATPRGVTARLFATATYRGAAAVVFVARDRRETLVYVLARSDCRLLTSQFFHE